MFAIYRVASDYSNAGYSAFVTDMIDLISGKATSVESLSSSCSKTGSRIVSDVPAGWRVVDKDVGSAATTGIKATILCAPWSDNPDRYKFLKLFNNSYGYNNSGGYYHFLQMSGYDSWSVVTHSATSPELIHGDFTIGATPVPGGYIVISASVNHLLVVSYGPKADWASTGGSGAWFLLSEYTRDDPWSTVEDGYPSWFVAGSAPYVNTGATGSSSYYRGIALAKVFDSGVGYDLEGHRAFTSTSSDYGYHTVELTADIPWVTRTPAGAGHTDQWLFGSLATAFSTFCNKPVVGSDKLARVVLFPASIRKGLDYGDYSTYGLNPFTGVWMGGNLAETAGLYFGGKPGVAGGASQFEEVEVNGAKFMALQLPMNGNTITKPLAMFVKES